MVGSQYSFLGLDFLIPEINFQDFFQRQNMLIWEGKLNINEMDVRMRTAEVKIKFRNNCKTLTL